MENLFDVIVFLIIAALWVISQVGRMRRRGGRTAPPRRPQRRGPGTTGQPPREEHREISLEEWIEQVRRGGQAPPPPRQRPRSRTPQRRMPEAVRGPQAPDTPRDILREWEERTKRHAPARRKLPEAEPAPTTPEEDPYAIARERTEERMRRAALEREERREAVRLEAARHQQEKRRELEERQERARRRLEEARRGRTVAVPRMPTPPAAPRMPRTMPKVRRSQGYGRRKSRASHIRADLDLSRKGLRQGIVMMEMLGTPVGLRTEPPPTQHFARRS